MPQRTPFVKVPLTHGKVALVSPEDAKRVLQKTWYALPRVRNGRVVFRARSSYSIGNGKSVGVYLHRFVMGFSPDDPEVDHKNGNPLDCRRGNLRPATDAQNGQNRRKLKRSRNPYRGIKKDKDHWTAWIGGKENRVYLGSYGTPEEAAQAYDDAARRLYGEFACVNFPREGERRAW